MGRHLRMGVVALALILAVSAVCSAQSGGAASVTVPEGTTVDTIKYGPDETAASLKPAEQVAFLFLYGMWSLEQRCLDRDSGIGRMGTLAELVKGVKMPDGSTVGLNVDPAKDRFYRYEIIIIGNDCVIRALPRDRSMGGFAVVGSPTRFTANFYFNPAGPDMTSAQKITEMGYSGRGFVR